MSATAPTSTPTTTLPRTIDTSQDQPVPFGRLVAVETRKVFDTRAGRWFSVAILGLVLVVTAFGALLFPEDSQTFVELLGLSGGVLGYFLPVLVILLVTSEWSQRTGLATFTLEPRRSRVVAAKLGCGLALSVVALALGALIAAGGTVLSTADGGEAVWTLGWEPVQSFLLTGLIGVLVGFTLAMLLRSSPAAIVGYFLYTFLLPAVAGTVAALVSSVEKIVPWVELNTAQQPLLTGDYRATGEEWAQLGTAALVWLVVPFALGLWRLLRAEVK